MVCESEGAVFTLESVLVSQRLYLVRSTLPVLGHVGDLIPHAKLKAESRTVALVEGNRVPAIPHQAVWLA